MRILLVEDEPDLGAALKDILNQHNYVVDWVKSGVEAWNYLETSWTKYHVAIFDWMLPGLSGVELLRRLRKQNSPLPVLMLTAKSTVEDKVTGLDSGADYYLVKPFGMAELLAIIRALQRRSPELAPAKLSLGCLSLNYSNNCVCVCDSEKGKTEVSLTSKEFQLLEYFMRHPDRIISRDQILSQVWDWNTETMSNVVAAQVRLLRRKLAQCGCANPIESIYGLGYRFDSNPRLANSDE
ncbi:two component transcriptional regulator, winged helix family (plasmid) [Stanieria cyanosphaera PCC 7437]|uniref:Two component transcriptional regulator, winged helix family n=1 Tax=Stanieria cyanosphaera (strain ATCC 29371 / PCC 7437) TaxID=111780 RepID=K9Y0G8_STAC7|nr:two-component system response regulator RppA [Stanieria cyanosphaera]AFZ38233.1 two component transcriptional regulator, winged helix family [Stanieria cyanosphaera PCC 7437]